MSADAKKLLSLAKKIKRCRVCEKELPLGPNPILRIGINAPILIVGQAPGLRVHQTGLPWNDPSGDKLRKWLDVTRQEFYNTQNFSIMPTGFCYPGRDAKGGDLPPRKECADLWWTELLPLITQYKLILLIGGYAHRLFLKGKAKSTLTETVYNWKEYYPPFIVCPHPSYRNNLWLKKNPWFTHEIIPFIQKTVSTLISKSAKLIYEPSGKIQ